MIAKTFAAGAIAAALTAFAAPTFAADPASPAPAALKAAPTKAALIVQSRDRYNRRVRIHNQTGWTMLRFYASDARVSDWQEDMLGSRVMGNGESWVMNIDDGNGGCVYDFKAEFTNGQVLTRMGVNVCQIADYYYTR